MNVLVADRSLLAFKSEFEAALPESANVVWAPHVDSGEFLVLLSKAQVLISSVFTERMGRATSNLWLIQVAGAGLDGIDMDAVPEGAVIRRTYHHEDSIAEYILGTVIMLRRGLVAQDQALRRGSWKSPAFDASVDIRRTLQGAKIGFLGFGRIGQKSWELLSACGAASGRAVTRSGRTDARAFGLSWVGGMTKLSALCRESDVMVLSVPLDASTEGVVGVDELLELGHGGLVVNVGRGGVVREGPLYDALRTGVIGGAAIDVWWNYPPDGTSWVMPSRYPFNELDNVVMTPHSSGVTQETYLGRIQDIANNVCELFEEGRI